MSINLDPTMHVLAGYEASSAAPLRNAVIAAAMRARAASKAGKGFGTQAQPKVSKDLLPEANCPCGSSQQYKDCCQPYHMGASTPETPETLLRHVKRGFGKFV